MSRATPVWWVLAVAVAACGSERSGEAPSRVSESPSARPVSAFVVNYPLQYFTERIAGELAEITFPAPREVDPAYWSPDAETVARYQEADLILLNGADYAKWVSLVSLPRASMVDTSSSFRDRYVPLDEGPVHTHGPEGEHSHTGYAFTTWLDLSLAIEHARAIAEALTAARPQQANVFSQGLAALEGDLSELDGRLANIAETLAGETVIFSHPVYQYLEKRYGIDGHSVHWEPDSEPNEAMWRELEGHLAKHPARWMIWEDEPLAETRERLAEVGVACLVLRPLANTPSSGDFLSAMTVDLSAIEAAARASRTKT